MTDIDSNRDANDTRTDQDNEKNVTSPIPGGNNAEAPRRKGEQGDNEGDKETHIAPATDDNIIERDKQNP